jgi:hypothetical protein
MSVVDSRKTGAAGWFRIVRAEYLSIEGEACHEGTIAAGSLPIITGQPSAWFASFSLPLLENVDSFGGLGL